MKYIKIYEQFTDEEDPWGEDVYSGPSEDERWRFVENVYKNIRKSFPLLLFPDDDEKTKTAYYSGDNFFHHAMNLLYLYDFIKKNEPLRFYTTSKENYLTILDYANSLEGFYVENGFDKKSGYYIYIDYLDKTKRVDEQYESGDDNDDDDPWGEEKPPKEKEVIFSEACDVLEKIGFKYVTTSNIVFDADNIELLRDCDVIVNPGLIDDCGEEMIFFFKKSQDMIMFFDIYNPSTEFISSYGDSTPFPYTLRINYY